MIVVNQSPVEKNFVQNPYTFYRQILKRGGVCFWKNYNQKAFFERLQSTVKETHLITLNDDMETYRLEEISPEIDDHEEENMKDFCSHVGKDGVITVQQAVNSFLNDDDKFTLSQVKKYF